MTEVSESKQKKPLAHGYQVRPSKNGGWIVTPTWDTDTRGLEYSFSNTADYLEFLSHMHLEDEEARAGFFTSFDPDWLNQSTISWNDGVCDD